jgi:hypothetical protein
MADAASLWRAFLGYFRKRPWLVIWICIFAAALALLGFTGQIYMQGSGHVTVYEWAAVSFIVGTWLIAKLGFRIDLTEEYLLGLIFGIQWEFLTHVYWTYLPDKFNVMVWKGLDATV